jgi:hypothetical protein
MRSPGRCWSAPRVDPRSDAEPRSAVRGATFNIAPRKSSEPPWAATRRKRAADAADSGTDEGPIKYRIFPLAGPRTQLLRQPYATWAGATLVNKPRQSAPRERPRRYFLTECRLDPSPQYQYAKPTRAILIIANALYRSRCRLREKRLSDHLRTLTPQFLRISRSNPSQIPVPVPKS